MSYLTGLRRYAEKYLFLLKLIDENTVSQAARILTKDEGKEVTETAVRGRLAFGRKLSRDARWFLNNLNILTQKSQRIKKFAVDGRIKKPKDDEDENEEQLNEKDFWGKKK